MIFKNTISLELHFYKLSNNNIKAKFSTGIGGQNSIAFNRADSNYTSRKLYPNIFYSFCFQVLIH